MKKILIPILILSSLTLSGCALFQKDPEVREVKIVTRPAEVILYQPPLPRAVGLENVKWHVITGANLEEKLLEIEKMQGGEFVIYAITPSTYENLSFNMQELRRYIREQQQIIVYYRTATTKDTNKDGVIDSDDWLNINSQLQAQEYRLDIQE
jgi:apolipoprotein N-acyltransferase